MKYFMIAILLSSTFQLIGQNYHPLLDSNKVWGELEYSWDNIFTTYYKAENDTLIDNKLYKKIYTSYLDSLMSNWRETGYYVREDSLQRVYLNYAGGTERLIYDFSLTIGDSIPMGDSVFGGYQYAFVDKIDSILINGFQRKMIFFKGYDAEYWIEGIGSSTTPFFPFKNYSAADVSWELLCVKENDFTIYLNQNYTDCYVVHFNHANELALENELSLDIYPNPSNGSFSIDLGAIYDKTKITITDLNGRVLQKYAFERKQLLKLKIDEIPGVYFLRISSGNKVLVVRLIQQ